MSQKNESSGGNTGMYVLAGVVGAVGAVVGYLVGKQSETSHIAHSPPSHSHTHNANRNYTDNDPNCAICLEHYSPVKTLPCKHKFHEDCVNKWLNINNTCPKCNSVVE